MRVGGSIAQYRYLPVPGPSRAKQAPRRGKLPHHSAATPFVAWRSAISVFVITLDGVTDTFKAGKDLAVGDGGSTSTVEMEPKLPVG